MAMPISTENIEGREESQSSEDEGEEGYGTGGYHFVQIGDTFKNGRYVVQKKLGWGHFSTVWLAWDTHENKYVALKVQKSAENYTEAALDELFILSQIRNGDPDDKKCIVRMLDHFRHSGPNGEHVCIVLEYLGDNLFTLIRYYGYKGMPLKMVKNICYYTLIGLDYLHRELSIIHTDLKPENVVLVSTIDSSKDPRKNGKPLILPPPAPIAMVSYSTVGLTKNQKKRMKIKAKKIALANSKKESVTDIQESKDNTAEIARKEVPADSGVKREDDLEKVVPLKKEDNVETIVPLRRMKLDVRKKIMTSIDLRCKIVDFGNSCWIHRHFTDDIQTRQYRAPEAIVKAGYSTPADMWSFACMAFELATGDVLFNPRGGEGFNKDEDHLASMMELIGVMPKEITSGGRDSHIFFNRAGQMKSTRKLCFCPLNRVLILKYKFNEQEANEFADFLVSLLDFVPEKRPTAAECLLHPWLNGAPYAPEHVQDQNENDVQRPETSEQVSNEKQPVLVHAEKGKTEKAAVKEAKFSVLNKMKKNNTGKGAGLKGQVCLDIEGCKSNGSVQVNVLPGNSSIRGCLPYSSMQVNKALDKITFEGFQSHQDVQAVNGPVESAQGQSRTWATVVKGGK